MADDHPIFRQGLKQVIELDTQLKVVAEASNGEQAVTQVSAMHPDVALLDVDMPLLDGFATALLIRKQHPSVKIVFLTLYKDEMHVNEALDLGAYGYLIKDSAAVDVVQCIKAVANGTRYISPTLADCLLQRSTRAGNRKNSREASSSRLTATERRVLAHLAEYKTNKEIAYELGVSIRTVENHRANICEKLELQGSHALVRFAIKNAQGC